MSERDKPYVLCGCIYAETAEKALLLQEVVRNGLGGQGFVVEEVVREDNVETRRMIAR